MRKPLLFLIGLSLPLFACANTPVDTTPNLDDLSFASQGDEKDSRPTPAVLPSEGEGAVAPLEIPAEPEHLSYFDNSVFASMDGIWNGYGFHHSSIFKYNHHYYLYTSTPDGCVGIRAWHSLDLKNWDACDIPGLSLGYVTKERTSYSAKAPRLIHYEGRFYLYANTPSGYQVFASASPDGPFEFDGTLNLASSYNGFVFASPNGKLFFLLGGENAISVYEMEDLYHVDLSSVAIIHATSLSQYSGDSVITDNPSLINVDGTLYLTYSQGKDAYRSYRSSYVHALSPDYSSASALARSFISLENGPLLVATNEMDGEIGLGDLCFVEGPDMVSYYGLYTSRENDNVRKVNLAPAFMAKSGISISSRQDRVAINEMETKELSDSPYEDLVLTDDKLGNEFTAEFVFEDLESIYFDYQSKNNTYALEFDENEARLVHIENGLKEIVSSVSILNHEHELKLTKGTHYKVILDGLELARDDMKIASSGKLGFQKKEDSNFRSCNYIKSIASSFSKEAYKPAESNLFAQDYLLEESNITDKTPLKSIAGEVTLQGLSCLQLNANRDYARWLTEVKEDGHYGVELTYNASFGYYDSNLGVRAGKDNPEYIVSPNKIKESGYVRTLLAEFDLSAGANEILIENLSNMPLRVATLRLVKTSATSPLFHESLAQYATKGVHYATDFLLNEQYHCHQSYEGAYSFAYVGDNTITDFEMTADIAFTSSLTITGFINLGFRCNHFASSRLDNEKSSVGYFLEISQFQTKLVRHNYGFDKTMGVMDLANVINTFAKFKITMKGNHITVYRDALRLFDVDDDLALSSGHLGFGAVDTCGLIRNIDVAEAK